MTDRWERLTDLYHAAVALTADERAALLTEECADDPALMADVERLVAAHDRARGPGEAPSASPESKVAQSPSPDNRLGPYRILKEIGRSRIGPVYLGERDDVRFDQRVAITVLEGEADANAALERLRSVHQTLGSRDYPMLARLVDVGTVENGRAYAAMEYIEGEPIDLFADGRRLSIAERLQLFVQVCSAVSHAHRRRIVHGALTPATILVTAGGVPKLLDYGIIAHNDTSAADIYALGVVLDTLMGAGSSNGERRRLREDLEAIVVRARRKEADRRYDSVEHLADDIRRYLDSPSARVRPDATRAPRSGAQRRALSPVFAWSLAAAAVSLLGVQVAALRPSSDALPPVAPAADAPAPRPRIAVADFADHVDDALLASAVSDAFRVGLTESPFLQLVSTRQARKAVVAVSVDTVNGRYAFTAQLTGPKGETLGGLTETATDSADVLTALGRLAERVRRQMGEGLATLSGTPRLDEVTTASLPALRAYGNAVRVITGGDRAGGIRLLKAAVALDTGFASAHRLLALTYRDMGDRARYVESLDHAIANQARLPFFERYHLVGSHALTVLADYATAIDAYRRLLERYPDDVRGLSNLALAHAARREYAVQESLLVRALAVDSSVPSLYASLALARVNRGSYDDARRVLDRIERRFPGLRSTQVTTIALAASAQDWEAAEREARRRVTPAPDDTVDALDGLETLAGIAMTQGRLNEATQSFRRILALGTKSGGGSPRRYLSAARRIAYLELRYHHSPSAAVATMDAALARVPLDRMEESDRPYDEIARLFADAGQPRRARDLMTQAARTRIGRQRGIDPNRRWTLGAIAMAEGQPWQGEIEILQAAEAHPCPICALPDLARAYEVAGKPDSAIATYERYLQTPWQSRVETDEAGLGFALRRLGELYQQQNERAKAAAQYSALLKLWKNADAELDPLLTDVRRRLEQTSR